MTTWRGMTIEDMFVNHQGRRLNWNRRLLWPLVGVRGRWRLWAKLDLKRGSMKKLRETTAEDLATIQTAVRGLKAIRTALRKRGAKRPAIYVQRAIKSVQGEERHALRAPGQQQGNMRLLPPCQHG